ncbi:MAG TPA: NAD+ synthase [Candidatus Thermoplasmatota archaeon]|nr:NAD+ synthase [Candidatus Thermoplasmatota archaeon]
MPRRAPAVASPHARPTREQPDRRRLVDFALPEDLARWEATITAFIARHIEAAGAKGVVLGASGGLDSAVVAALCVKALGKRNVVCVILPSPDSDPKDEAHARLSCKSLGVTPILRPIGPVLEGFETSLAGKPDKRVKGNAKSRSRMMLLYAEAQSRGMLVCGTGNKSELLTGYFTKHGDGGVDLQPIGDLYKTQVRELGKHLGVPKPILSKPPSAGLYPGQTDEADMGLTYEQLDAILRGMELNHPLPTIVRKTGLDASLVRKVDRMVRSTEHKRRLALIPKIGARTVGIDWRRAVHWDA